MDRIDRRLIRLRLAYYGALSGIAVDGATDWAGIERATSAWITDARDRYYTALDLADGVSIGKRPLA